MQTLSMLQPNPNLKFDPIKHQYTVFGEPVPWSVTGITSYDQDPKVKAIIDKTKHIWEPRGNSFEHCRGFVALCSISAAMAGGLHILGSIGSALGGAQDLATHVPITRWSASDEANLGLSSLEARAREQTRRSS